MKKVLTVIIVTSVILTSVFSSSLTDGKWGLALSELDVRFAPFTAFVEGGLAYRGFKFIPENTTKLQVMVGFPTRQIPEFWQSTPIGTLNSLVATELSANFQLHQGFFRDFLDVYIGADLRYNNSWALNNKTFTPSIIGGAKLNGQVDNRVDLIGWTLSADISTCPSKNFTVGANATAGFTPVQIKGKNNRNLFSIVIKDRVSYLHNTLWFNSSDKSTYNSLVTIYNLKVQKIFRGLNRGSAFANGELVANQIDVRLAGPEFTLFNSKTTSFPRLNFFFDFGGVFNRGTLTNVNNDLFPSSKFLMTAGFQAGFNLFETFDLLYQGAFPIIKTKDNTRAFVSTICLGLTF